MRFVILLVCLLLDAGPPPVAPSTGRAPWPPADTAGLSDLVGSWRGRGQSYGTPVADSLTFAPALDGRFLRFEMLALGGDRFRAEGYLWTTGPAANTGSVSLAEYSTGAWPIRALIGQRVGTRILLEEHRPERDIRIILELENRDRLVLQEVNLRARPPIAFVDEVFTRVSH